MQGRNHWPCAGAACVLPSLFLGLTMPKQILVHQAINIPATPFIGRRRRRLMGVLGLGLSMPVLGSMGCVALTDLTRFHVSMADLVAAVERQFPREQRVLDAIDVVLRLPKLRLLPQTNRLATELTIQARERIFGRSTQGLIGFEYGLRFEPKDFSARLANVQVSSVALDAGPSLSSTWQGVAQAVTQRLLEDMTVVKLSNQRADALRQLSLHAAALTVTERGLDIRFTQAPRPA